MKSPPYFPHSRQTYRSEKEIKYISQKSYTGANNTSKTYISCNSKSLIQSDKQRNNNLPLFQPWLRRMQGVKNPIWKVIAKIMYRLTSALYCNDIQSANIGYGLYIGHPFCITVNSKAVIGNNVNIHKGVTIGQENRGKRKGAPTIGSKVWIGINSTIVGNIKIGNNVLIAPNSFVNIDIPDNSVAFGNPVTIHHCENATAGYIENVFEVD